MAWPALNAFAFSFVIISFVWWYHHALFVTYVVLNTATVVMNFALLASLALGIYFQQTTVHFLTRGINTTAPQHLWFACMALTCALLGGMYAVGIWSRRGTLDAPSLLAGLAVMYQACLSAAGLAGLGFAFPHSMRASLAIVIAVVIAAALQRRTVYGIARALHAPA